MAAGSELIALAERANNHRRLDVSSLLVGAEMRLRCEVADEVQRNDAHEVSIHSLDPEKNQGRLIDWRAPAQLASSRSICLNADVALTLISASVHFIGSSLMPLPLSSCCVASQAESMPRQPSRQESGWPSAMRSAMPSSLRSRVPAACELFSRL